MTIIYIFPIAPVALAILIMVFALAGQLVTILPTIEIVVWILFALYCGFCLLCWLGSDLSGTIRKVISLAANVVSCVFIGILTYGFFRSMYESYGNGDLNGTFEFILTVQFGGVGWLLGLYMLSWAGFNLLEASDDSFFKKLLGSAALYVLYFMF